MREIKFRGKDEKGKWYYGYHYKDNSGTYIKRSSMSDRSRGIKVLPETVGQYTGVNDKNNNIVFFGDILRFSDKKEWYRGKYGIKMMFSDEKERRKLQEAFDKEPYEERLVEDLEDYDWLLSGDLKIYWEIVGNIHDNPELLKNND